MLTHYSKDFQQRTYFFGVIRLIENHFCLLLRPHPVTPLEGKCTVCRFAIGPSVFTDETDVGPMEGPHTQIRPADGFLQLEKKIKLAIIILRPRHILMLKFVPLGTSNVGENAQAPQSSHQNAATSSNKMEQYVDNISHSHRAIRTKLLLISSQ